MQADLPQQREQALATLAQDLPVFVTSVRAALAGRAATTTAAQTPVAPNPTDRARVITGLRALLQASDMDARRYFEQNQSLLTDTLGTQSAASLGKFVAEFLFEEALALLDGTK